MTIARATSITILAVSIASWGCAADSGNHDYDGTSGCNTTQCWNACELTGHASGGYCSGEDCVCVEDDAGTDTGTDTHADVPTDGTPSTCNIDILFVVDTSGSMMDATANLAEVAFPQFATELEAYPELGTYRVAFKTHLYGENEVTDGVFVQDSLFLTMGWPYGTPHDAFECEESPTVDCGFASGESWMVGPSATLLDEFGCVGNVACHQNVFTGEPTLQAGHEGLVFPANAGFLRDEALLVVVYITDEEDQSTKSIDLMRQNLLDLKGGDERYVVVVTLGGPEVGTVEVNSVYHTMGCISPNYGATEQTPRIIDFTEQFGTRGLHYDLCVDDIAGALTSAMDALEMSCGEIIF